MIDIFVPDRVFYSVRDFLFIIENGTTENCQVG